MPSICSAMHEIADHAALRGLEEDHPDMLGEDKITRGELVALYGGAPEPFGKAPVAYEGVIIDVGERVSSNLIPGWEKRLESLDNVEVRIVRVHDALQLPFPYIDKVGASAVCRWRVFRKLAKRAKRLSKQEQSINPPAFFLRTLSQRKQRITTIVPLRAESPFA